MKVAVIARNIDQILACFRALDQHKGSVKRMSQGYRIAEFKNDISVFFTTQGYMESGLRGRKIDRYIIDTTCMLTKDQERFLAMTAYSRPEPSSIELKSIEEFINELCNTAEGSSKS